MKPQLKISVLIICFYFICIDKPLFAQVNSSIVCTAQIATKDSNESNTQPLCVYKKVRPYQEVKVNIRLYILAQDKQVHNYDAQAYLYINGKSINFHFDGSPVADNPPFYTTQPGASILFNRTDPFDTGVLSYITNADVNGNIEAGLMVRLVYGTSYLNYALYPGSYISIEE
jgi:hypothetical protein